MSDAEHQVPVPFRNKASTTHSAAVFASADPNISYRVPFRPPICVRADGLDAVIGRLPEDMQGVLKALVPTPEDINEIRLIAGYSAIAKVGQGEDARELLFSEKLSAQDLAAVAGDLKFADLERAALPSQLHRFSCWQGPGAGDEGAMYGLVMCVGKTVTGLAYAFADILSRSKSVLSLAPPGYGKTTLLRDIIRLTSGRALEQAFRNGTPVIIFCDEMATKEEAEAEALVFASQAGTRVIATAHGDLDKFVMSKPLASLSDSVQASTISDDAANPAR